MARTTGSHSQITGPKIEAAALRLFASHGYAAVTMRQIAREVGLQAGALYNYVPHKQALLFRLMDGHMDDILARITQVVDPATPAREALTDLVGFHIAYHLERPDLLFIAYMELRSLEPENFTALEAKRSAYEAHIEGILNRGRDSGEFNVVDVKLTVFALISMLTGVTNWFREGGRLDIEAVTGHYTDMALRLVGADAGHKA